MAAVPSDMSATLPTMISFISFAEGAFNPIPQVVAEDAKPYVSHFFFHVSKCLLRAGSTLIGENSLFIVMVIL